MRWTTSRVFLLFILVSKGMLILRGVCLMRRVTGYHECMCVCERACASLRFMLGPSLLCLTQGQPPQAAFPRLLAGCGQLGGRPESGRKEETRLFLPGTSCIPSLHRLHSYSCCLVGAATVPASSAAPSPGPRQHLLLPHPTGPKVLAVASH